MTLKEANDMVDGLWHAVNHGGAALNDVPRIVKNILITGAWKERKIRTGEIIKHTRFSSFITTKPLAGCGWKASDVQKLISEDPETLVLWREAMKGQEGGNTTSDIITGAGAATGTSRAYTLSRLKREFPDLFQQVVAGELSANAAAIKAGFRRKTTPLHNLRAAWKKATQAERDQFLSEVA